MGSRPKKDLKNNLKNHENFPQHIRHNIRGRHRRKLPFRIFATTGRDISAIA